MESYLHPKRATSRIEEETWGGGYSECDTILRLNIGVANPKTDEFPVFSYPLSVVTMTRFQCSLNYGGKDDQGPHLRSRCTQWQAAPEGEHIDDIGLLLQSGADVNYQAISRDGRTAIPAAAGGE